MLTRDEILAEAAGARMIHILLRTWSESNMRGAWQKRHSRAKGQRFIVGAVLSQHEKPTLPCMVILERVAPRELDDDNLRGALKAVRDEVAAWLSVDDRDKRVSWDYTQRKGRVREYAVGIEII